jgi:ribose-phosphate pyrophosphokinase
MPPLRDFCVRAPTKPDSRAGEVRQTPACARDILIEDRYPEAIMISTTRPFSIDEAGAALGIPRPYVLLAGTGHPTLAAEIAARLGVSLGACRVERFPDGEVAAELEQSVRGHDVFVVQPTSPPVNDHLVELLVIADACRRADAERITAIVPYFGYARSDRRSGRRVPVMARVVADAMQSIGIDHVVTLDAHTPQIEGFFRIPIDNLSIVATMCAGLTPLLTHDTVIVSPDLGGAKRATEVGERLGHPVAVCVKRRTNGESVAITQVIGDVRNRACVIVDDMITTGGTIAEAAKALRAEGARDGMVVMASHGVLVPGARAKMRAAGVRAVLVSDSIPVESDAELPVTGVAIAPLLAEVVERLMAARSLRDLY